MQHFSPVILVLASKEAEQMCQGASGLDVVELLRLHGTFTHLNKDNGGA